MQLLFKYGFNSRMASIWKIRCVCYFLPTDSQEKSKGAKSQEKNDSISIPRVSSDSNMSTSSQSNISQAAAAISQVCCLCNLLWVWQSETRN